MAINHFADLHESELHKNNIFYDDQATLLEEFSSNSILINQLKENYTSN